MSSDPNRWRLLVEVDGRVIELRTKGDRTEVTRDASARLVQEVDAHFRGDSEELLPKHNVMRLMYDPDTHLVRLEFTDRGSARRMELQLLRFGPLYLHYHTDLGVFVCMTPHELVRRRQHIGGLVALFRREARQLDSLITYDARRRRP